MSRSLTSNWVSVFTSPFLHHKINGNPSNAANGSNQLESTSAKRLNSEHDHLPVGISSATSQTVHMLSSQFDNESPIDAHSLNSSDTMVREIWIINQPKCGTGSLVDTVIKPENCKGEGVNKQILLYSCPQQGKVFRTHNFALASKHKESRRDAHVGVHTHNSCFVVSALRDPHNSIPSLFFEHNKGKFCDGRQSGAEILAEYNYWLRNSIEPELQMRTVFEVSKAFGLQDFGAVLERMKRSGFAVFEESSSLDSPWNGCKLLLVQLDFEKNNGNISKGFSALLGESIVAAQGPTRDELCPQAKKNYQMIKDYVIGEDVMAKLTKDSPELRHGFDYYRKARVSGDHITMATTPPTIAEGQPSPLTLATRPTQESQSNRWLDPHTIEKKVTPSGFPGSSSITADNAAEAVLMDPMERKI